MPSKQLPPSSANTRRNRIRGVALLVFTTVFSAVAGRLPPTYWLAQGYETIELRRTGENHFYLVGRVEGRRRSCLVDTGWSYTTVSTNTAARLTSPHAIGKLQLGQVVLTEVPAREQDLRVNGRPAPYDVVLGYDFLNRQHAVIDYANRRLHLRRAAASAEEDAQFERSLRESGLVAVSLKRREPLAITCRARLNGQEVELLVDSGARWSCLDTRVATAMGLRITPSPLRMMGAGASGRREIGVADLKRIELGGHALRSASVAVLDLADWGLGPAGKGLSDVGGILGGAELVAAGAVIDCGREQLWLRARR